METVTLPYQEFLSREWHYLLTVRTLGDWQVLSSSEGEGPVGPAGERRADGQTYLLLVVNPGQQTVIECRYDSWQERYRDVEMLRRLPPSGASGAGALAWLSPILPALTGAAAKLFPAALSEPETEADHPDV